MIKIKLVSYLNLQPINSIPKDQNSEQKTLNAVQEMSSYPVFCSCAVHP